MDMSASTHFAARDPIAMAVEENLREMQAVGYGEFSMQDTPTGVAVSFGNLRALAESYDIALVRLAGEILINRRLGEVFLHRIRSSGPLLRH